MDLKRASHELSIGKMCFEFSTMITNHLDIVGCNKAVELRLQEVKCVIMRSLLSKSHTIQREKHFWRLSNHSQNCIEEHE